MAPSEAFPWIDLVAMFFTLAGFIVGLGSVTVIEMHAWLARRSCYWTEATTRTHKITKPLIWIGLAQAFAGSCVLYRNVGFTPITTAQLCIGLLVVANGVFLTIFVSPVLIAKEREGQAKELLSVTWQRIIFCSFLLSWAGWWSEIILFSVYLVTR